MCMKIWFNANILERINKLKHENETVTNFIIRAVDYYVRMLEDEQDE